MLAGCSELLVWRAQARSDASSSLSPSVACSLGLILDRLLQRLLLSASQSAGGGGHCHGKHIVLALRGLLEDDALRQELMRHVGAAAHDTLSAGELNHLHADVPIVAAMVDGTRPLTARAALVLTASLQAVTVHALRAVVNEHGESGGQPCTVWDLEGLASLLSSHHGLLRLLLTLDADDAGAAACAESGRAGGSPIPWGAQEASPGGSSSPESSPRSVPSPPGDQRGDADAEGAATDTGVPAPADVQAGCDGEAASAGTSSPLGPAPPPVWLDELLQLRKERRLG